MHGDASSLHPIRALRAPAQRATDPGRFWRIAWKAAARRAARDLRALYAPIVRMRRRLRRVTIHHVFWAIFLVLMAVYGLVLLTQATGAGRGGR